MRRLISILSSALVLGGFCQVALSANLLYMNSEPGDYIGQGEIREFGSEDGTFSASVNFDNGVSINFSGDEHWNVDFAAPQAVPLEPGAYEGATRFPFQSPTAPGLSVSGDGRGCNTLTGRFVVLEVEYADDTVVSFAADFEQHCEGADPALFGSVRYNSTLGFEPQVSVTVNGSFLPVEVSVGETVSVSFSVEGGDRTGELAEWWVGRVGPYSDFWLQSGVGWVKGNAQPWLWKQQALAESQQVTMQHQFDKTGVFVFTIAVDLDVDGELDAQYVDHVVVTVK